MFLTEKKGRFANGAEKWVGIIPRVQGLPGFKAWDMAGELALEYQSLCDVAPNLWAIGRIQQFGTNEERDILGSLRGFQLKSAVKVTATALQGSAVEITFRSWSCSAHDRYDWNYSEYLTVKNPDYQSKAPDAVMPDQRELTVYHSNAKRLEDAGQAAPYNVVLKPWLVSDSRVVGKANMDVARKL